MGATPAGRRKGPGCVQGQRHVVVKPHRLLQVEQPFSSPPLCSTAAGGQELPPHCGGHLQGLCPRAAQGVRSRPAARGHHRLQQGRAHAAVGGGGAGGADGRGAAFPARPPRHVPSGLVSLSNFILLCVLYRSMFSVLHHWLCWSNPQLPAKAADNDCGAECPLASRGRAARSPCPP